MPGPITFLRKFKRFIRGEQAWNKKYARYKEQLEYFKSRLPAGTNITEYACLDDNTYVTAIEPHYTYHPAWAARVIAQIKPAKHIDISSITSFGTVLSAFIPVEFYDYRPANIRLSGYTPGRADLTDLHFGTDSIESLSCMHTVEHIGLGRYGDPLDIEGDVKAIKELQRVVKKDGNLLFVVPVGDARIEFNAHRVYAYETIIHHFDEMELVEFALIPDDFENTGYLVNPPMEIISKQHWGCGCFWFTKK